MSPRRVAIRAQSALMRTCDSRVMPLPGSLPVRLSGCPRVPAPLCDHEKEVPRNSNLDHRSGPRLRHFVAVPAPAAPPFQGPAFGRGLGWARLPADATFSSWFILMARSRAVASRVPEFRENRHKKDCVASEMFESLREPPAGPLQ